jgi:hypothetical protein
MERDEEKSKGFKVDDRRRFSAEGELKPEFREGAAETPPPGASQATAAQAASAGIGAGSPAEDSMRAAAEAQAPHAQAHPQHGAAAAEITFGTFLVGLSTQALVHLGDIADPQSGEPTPDLVAAQQLIDIIGMLEHKTRGNLDRDEAQLIEAILYELRMKYVERVRPAR